VAARPERPTGAWTESRIAPARGGAIPAATFFRLSRSLRRSQTTKARWRRRIKIGVHAACASRRAPRDLTSDSEAARHKPVPADRLACRKTFQANVESGRPGCAEPAPLARHHRCARATPAAPLFGRNPPTTSPSPSSLYLQCVHFDDGQRPIFRLLSLSGGRIQFDRIQDRPRWRRMGICSAASLAGHRSARKCFRSKYGPRQACACKRGKLTVVSAAAAVGDATCRAPRPKQEPVGMFKLNSIMARSYRNICRRELSEKSGRQFYDPLDLPASIRRRLLLSRAPPFLVVNV
jgi:hypothetical protein